MRDVQKIIANVLMVAGMGSCFSGIAFQAHCADVRPRMPRPESGQTSPLVYKRTTVYVSTGDLWTFELLFDAGIVIAILGGILSTVPKPKL